MVGYDGAGVLHGLSLYHYHNYIFNLDQSLKQKNNPAVEVVEYCSKSKADTHTNGTAKYCDVGHAENYDHLLLSRSIYSLDKKTAI